MSFATPIGALTAGLSEALPYLTSLVFNPEQLHGAALISRIGKSGLSGLTQNPLSANEIIRTLRNSGFKVQRQSALKVIKSFKAQLASGLNFGGLDRGLTPQPGFYAPALHPMSSDYLDRVMVPGLDPATGQPKVAYITIMHDELLSSDQIIAQAQRSQAEKYGIYEPQWGQAIIVTRMRDPRVPVI